MNTTTKKNYVVFHGQKPGIYNTWIDCYAQASSFKNNVVRLYDTIEEGQVAWDTFSSKNHRSLLSTAQIEEAIADVNGGCLDFPNPSNTLSGELTCICNKTSNDTVFGNTIESWLLQCCTCMRIESPVYTLHDTRIIHDNRHYKFRASMYHKSIGKPPVSIGNYARTVEKARDDVAVTLLRRLLSSNRKIIVDYNQYNVDLLEEQLQKSFEENIQLRLDYVHYKKN